MPFNAIERIAREFARRFRLPKDYGTLLTYENGTLAVSGDAIKSQIVSDIEDVLGSSASEVGSIRIRQDGRIVFSGIEDHLHQRIRNLLLNP